MFVEIIPDKKIYMSGLFSTKKKIPLPGEAVNYLVAQSNHIFQQFEYFSEQQISLFTSFFNDDK